MIMYFKLEINLSLKCLNCNKLVMSSKSRFLETPLPHLYNRNRKNRSLIRMLLMMVTLKTPKMLENDIIGSNSFILFRIYYKKRAE